MLDRPIVAFDIETIPDPEIGRRILGIPGTDEDVVTEMVHRRLEETGGSTEYPQLPWHRIVTICATTLDPRTGSFEVRALGGHEFDERSHLEGFFGLVSGKEDAPRLVSWNGNGFDLPVIRYRSIMLGVCAPDFYRVDGPWRWNNYENRYHDMHLDVMDVLSGYGASTRVGLHTFGEVLGLPGKSFLERAVYAHVLQNEAGRVVEYCKLDTIETILVFLVWGCHCGWLARERLRELVDELRRTLGRETFAGWRDVVDALAGWPAWAA